MARCDAPEKGRPVDSNEHPASRTRTDPSVRIVLALRRILHATEQHSASLQRSIGLTTSQLVVLEELAARGETTATDLARSLSVSAPTMTGILNRLQVRGLVRRRRSDVDRRRTPVSITSAARSLLRSAPTPLPPRFHDRLERASGQTQQRVVRELERIAALMGNDE
jgi:DNA-binding MarR family transcriptional regulator